MNIQEKLNSKTAIIGVLGLGYVGLPLAVSFAEAGYKVIGYDVQSDKVKSLKLGLSYIEDVDDARLKKVVYRRQLDVTDDISQLHEADAICICVPTPLTKQKDPVVTYIENATKGFSPYLREGQLVILESTTYPGTTRDLVLPILETSGLKAGQDFLLAFSPERVDPVNKKYTFRNTPKVVGGFDSASTQAAGILYGSICDKVVPVSSMEVAEVTKLFENCFRLVNIAYVNEFAELCERMGISIWEVIDSAQTKPFGYMPFYPGPGIGGHCIPINPYFLFCKAREHDFHIRFLELATGVNEQMPYSTASKIIEAISCAGKSIKEANILVLGVSYKKDIGDTRESPSLKLIEILLQKGARVSYNDPYVRQIQIQDRTMSSEELSPELLASADCVVIATDHSAYDFQNVVDNARLVFDTRGVTRENHGVNCNGRNNVVRLGEGDLKKKILENLQVHTAGKME